MLHCLHYWLNSKLKLKVKHPHLFPPNAERIQNVLPLVLPGTSQELRPRDVPCTQALAVRHREIRGMPLAECRDISDGGPLQKILNVADAKVAADSPQRIDSGNSSAHCIAVQVNWVARMAWPNNVSLLRGRGDFVTNLLIH